MLKKKILFHLASKRNQGQGGAGRQVEMSSTSLICRMTFGTWPPAKYTPLFYIHMQHT